MALLSKKIDKLITQKDLLACDFHKIENLITLKDFRARDFNRSLDHNILIKNIDDRV